MKQIYPVCPFTSDGFNLDLEETGRVSNGKVGLQTGGTDLCIGEWVRPGDHCGSGSSQLLKPGNHSFMKFWVPGIWFAVFGSIYSQKVCAMSAQRLKSVENPGGARRCS